jgi:hypothetical protein
MKTTGQKEVARDFPGATVCLPAFDICFYGLPAEIGIGEPLR